MMQTTGDDPLLSILDAIATKNLKTLGLKIGNS